MLNTVQKATQGIFAKESQYEYILLGGGNAAGYFAAEYVKKGGPKGKLAIITDEKYVSYERPTLSKNYLQPDGPRLPGFHATAGGGGEKQDIEWYKNHQIEYVLSERISKVSTKEKKLVAESGNTYTYSKLIVGTGARTMHLADFKTPGYDLKGIYYLRDIADADLLNEAIQKNKGKKVVVVGGGYIGLEVTSKLQQNGLHATMIFPETWFMERIFNQEVSNVYMDIFKSKGIKVEKGKLMTGFEGSNGEVKTVLTKQGDKFDCDMVVIGMGARPNQELFIDQVDVADKPIGGIITNEHLQSVSDSNVYAIGDMAAFPLEQKYGGGLNRQEHVTNCRSTATYVANELLEGNKDGYKYQPFFYSRVFNLAWQFYGSNKGTCVVFGDYHKDGKFGAYFINDQNKIIGTFIESGSQEENAAMKNLAAEQPKTTENQLKHEGLHFATQQAKMISSN